MVLTSFLPLDWAEVEASTPVTSSGALFILTGFPHELIAIDLANGAKPSVKWRIRPEAKAWAASLACCGKIDNGPTQAGSELYLTTLDGQVSGVDATSGEIRWTQSIADPARGETITSPPTVVKNRVLVGGSGGDYGARGWIAALARRDGVVLWRKYSTGTDAEVGIGERFATQEDLGIRTWSPESWKTGGGSVEGPILFDPVTGMLFHTTGHPAPWNPDTRGGDNKWTSGLFARDLATGEAQWFRGFNPQNPVFFGSAGANLVVDWKWQGKSRALLIHVDPNGFLYVLDRSTGEILAADSFLPANLLKGIDRVSGEARYDTERMPTTNNQIRNLCPAWDGATGGLAAGSDSGILVLPVSRLCMDIEPRQANFIAGTPFIGANIRVKLSPEGTAAGLIGWSLDERKPLWRIDEALPLAGDPLVTESGIVFYGTIDGTLKAVDIHTGEPLWSTPLSPGIMSRPILFALPQGKQALAVVAGPGRVHGMNFRQGMDSRDATAGLGMAAVFAPTMSKAEGKTALYVFGLP